MSNVGVLILIAVMALVTAALRFAPFVIFKGKKTPEYIDYLGKYLPYAIIGMLVIFCIKNISLASKPYGVPELAAIIAVVLLHVWKRNTLLSIFLGTVFYMILVQVVFV